VAEEVGVAVFAVKGVDLGKELLVGVESFVWLVAHAHTLTAIAKVQNSHCSLIELRTFNTLFLTEMCLAEP
jgi:hypothetical protein